MSNKIILLNGVGSVGKSSIATALQKITAEPFLHIEMDTFLATLPEPYWNHPDGLCFETMLDQGKPSVRVRTGPVVERLLKGMRLAIAGLAAAGNNLIVDEVLFGNVPTSYGNAISEYRTLLAPYKLFFVGVFASLETLENRERQRGDRMIGLARWQFERVHRHMDYDLEIDAGHATAAECARLIKERFGL